MKIRNVSDRNLVVDPKGGHEPFAADAGETVDVPSDVAKSLLEQPDRWAKPTTSTKKKEG